jgi:hypothetical protein
MISRQYEVLQLIKHSRKIWILEIGLDIVQVPLGSAGYGKGRQLVESKKIHCGSLRAGPGIAGNYAAQKDKLIGMEKGQWLWAPVGIIDPDQALRLCLKAAFLPDLPSHHI